jgi:hypothetical protein
MRWKKRGVVWKPQGNRPWARSHATAPTPVLVDEETIRIYVTCCDEKGRGRPVFIEVSADDPAIVLKGPSEPLLDLGEPGSFDDNGIMATSVVRTGPGATYMYYVGFETLTSVRYRMLTGLAISGDGGVTFQRKQTTPLLERSPAERLFRCAPCVLFEEGRFKLWYAAGSSWETVNGKAMPVYDLRYQESSDGIRWQHAGRQCLELTGRDEHGFGRPWVRRRADTGQYQLFYSIRRRSLSAYRLGYAESTNGIEWIRKDEEMGLDVSSRGPDSEAIMYSAFLEAHGKSYCFYNGNEFGREGICLAEMTHA